MLFSNDNCTVSQIHMCTIGYYLKIAHHDIDITLSTIISTQMGYIMKACRYKSYLTQCELHLFFTRPRESPTQVSLCAI